MVHGNGVPRLGRLDREVDQVEIIGFAHELADAEAVAGAWVAFVAEQGGGGFAGEGGGLVQGMPGFGGL